MSSQVWALAGVVVGALLGGLAQMVAQQLQARHERKRATRDQRRDAYQEFLAAAHAALLDGPWANRLIEEGTVSDKIPLDLAERARALSARLLLAHTLVELVAPRDTAQAAGLFAVAVRAVINDRPGPDSVSDRRQEFIRLAKRDLMVTA